MTTETDKDDSSTPDSKTCPQCGGAVEDDFPEPLCPACLISDAIAATEQGSAGGEGAAMAVPNLEEVQAALPQFEIIEMIGRGGMGAVFKARQPRLDRLVAIKVLPAAFSSAPAFAQRFTREAKVLARLNHPNIVTLHDFGHEGDYFYLLMEFVDGVNLRQAMRAGRFTPEQALDVVPKICEALQFAHGEGVLHRDIKPDNILLTSNGQVKIADFGIAKVVGQADLPGRDQDSESASAPATGLTAASSTLGTPQYMAPEQLADPKTVDHRADIFSLGVVFYEMLTGELPTGRFAPPSEKSAADQRLDAVVLRALEQQRDRRQQSVEQLGTEVETIASTSAPPAESKPRNSVSRAFAIAALVFLILTVLHLTITGIDVTLKLVRGITASEIIVEDLKQKRTGIQDQLADYEANTLGQNTEALAAFSPGYRELQEREREVSAKVEEVTEFGRDPLQPRFLTHLAKQLAPIPLLVLLVFTMLFGWLHLIRLHRAGGGPWFGPAACATLTLPLVYLCMWIVLISLVFSPWGTVANLAITAGIAVLILLLHYRAWRTIRSWVFPETAAKRTAQVTIHTLAGLAAMVVLLCAGALSHLVSNDASNRTDTSAPREDVTLGSAHSSLCVSISGDVHFVVYYDGSLSTQSLSTSDPKSGTWNNHGSVVLGNGKTINFTRTSSTPQSLQLNEDVFDLARGKVFSIDDSGSVQQINIGWKIPIRFQGQLAQLAAAVRDYEDRALHSYIVPTENVRSMEGEPEIFFSWQSVGTQNNSQPWWQPDGSQALEKHSVRLQAMNSNGSKPRTDEGPLMLKMAVYHPAIDALSQIAAEFTDPRGAQLPFNISVSREHAHPDWRLVFKPMGRPDNLPDFINVRLAAGVGPWEAPVYARMPADFGNGSMEIEFAGFININHLGMSADAREAVMNYVFRKTSGSDSWELACVAVTHDGTVVASSGRSISHQGDVEAYTLRFPLLLNEIDYFQFQRRAVREFLYENVPLLPVAATPGR